MKFNKIASINLNRANNQVSLILKSKQMKLIGMTPEQLMDMTILKPQVKFNKKQKEDKK